MQQNVIHISWGAIVGGVLLILLGCYLALFQAISGVTNDILSQAVVAHASPEFLNWLRLLGVLTAVRGIYLVSTSVFRSSTLIGLVIRMGDEVLSLLVIPLLLWLRERVELVPIVSIRNGQAQRNILQGTAAATARHALTTLIALVVLGVVVSVIRLLIGQTGAHGTASSG
jgi:uncharacterized membrane protein YciS (DUF1049 family)